MLLTPADAAGLHQRNGGHLTDPSDIGQDPLANDPQKYAIRDEEFASRCISISFDPLFQQVANGYDQIFREALKWFIAIT